MPEIVVEPIQSFHLSVGEGRSRSHIIINEQVLDIQNPLSTFYTASKAASIVIVVTYGLLRTHLFTSFSKVHIDSIINGIVI